MSDKEFFSFYKIAPIDAAEEPQPATPSPGPVTPERWTIMGWECSDPDCPITTHPHYHPQQRAVTPSPGAQEALPELAQQLAQLLDGQTKGSRDCRLSGEYLASLIWPTVEAALESRERALRAADVALEAANDALQIYKEDKIGVHYRRALQAEAALEVERAARIEAEQKLKLVIADRHNAIEQRDKAENQLAEAITVRDSYVNFTQPAVLRRAEAAETQLNRVWEALGRPPVSKDLGELVAETVALATRSTRRLAELSEPGFIGAFAARDMWKEKAEEAIAAKERAEAELALVVPHSIKDLPKKLYAAERQVAALTSALENAREAFNQLERYAAIYCMDRNEGATQTWKSEYFQTLLEETRALSFPAAPAQAQEAE